eukprot:10317336-Karenia_brevis.AAC.1
MQQAQNQGDFQEINSFSRAWKEAFESAAEVVAVEQIIEPKRPWISECTLQHILSRRQAQQHGNFEESRRINKLIKQSVKEDRARWFEEILKDGNWSAIQKFRKFKP